jgi:hypothetical protein
LQKKKKKKRENVCSVYLIVDVEVEEEVLGERFGLTEAPLLEACAVVLHRHPEVAAVDAVVVQMAHARLELVRVQDMNLREDVVQDWRSSERRNGCMAEGVE